MLAIGLAGFVSTFTVSAEESDFEPVTTTTGRMLAELICSDAGSGALLLSWDEEIESHRLNRSNILWRIADGELHNLPQPGQEPWFRLSLHYLGLIEKSRKKDSFAAFLMKFPDESVAGFLQISVDGHRAIQFFNPTSPDKMEVTVWDCRAVN